MKKQSQNRDRMVMGRTSKTAGREGGWHTDSVLRDGVGVRTQSGDMGRGDDKQEWDPHRRSTEISAPAVL